jgi:uncharacterized membrane-anchored protein
MRLQHLPSINLRYWIGITLASIFGTNMGDFYAHESGLAILPGLGVLALLCGGVFAAERFDRGSRELYYWLVIIVVRTGATNIADYSAFGLHIPPVALNAGLITLLAVLAMLQARSQSTRSSSSRLSSTGPIYWIAMLTAGVLGTALGDLCEHAVGQGVAALGLTAALIAVLVWRRGNSGAYYWLIIAVARTAGTAIGDWIAENHTLNIGLAYSTLMTGLLFTGTLVLSRDRTTTAEGAAG